MKLRSNNNENKTNQTNKQTKISKIWFFKFNFNPTIDGMINTTTVYFSLYKNAQFYHLL